jgi:nucleotide-binding universal stress UspA family protein
MSTPTKRRSFEPGHHRKFLVVADDSKEVESALLFAAGRVQRSGGQIKLLYVIEPDAQFWGGVRQLQIDEETNKAKALFRLFRRKLAHEGFDQVVCEETILEGKRVDMIGQEIERDEDIAILVLGAAVDSKGPGPLIAALVAGSTAGKFPIPITIVPGGLTTDFIKSMA